MNILGIRKYTILYRTEGDSIKKYRIIIPITEKQEKELDDNSRLTIGENFIVNGDKIITYGEHEIDKKEGRNFIRKLNICSLDKDNYVYTDINFKTGEVFGKEGEPYLQTPTWDNVIWFKYNLCLIGNPERIAIFDINHEDLTRLHNAIN